MAPTNHLQQLVVVILMMAVAFYIQELPGSNVLQMALPEWPFVLALYFSVSSRYTFGVTAAFVVGIIEDVFLGIPTVGLHAAIYVLAAFTMTATRQRFRHMSIATQSLFVGGMVVLKVAAVMIYNAVLYSLPSHFWVLLSVPLSMLLWPGIHLFFGFFSVRHEG